jgi:hypothetical protein
MVMVELATSHAHAQTRITDPLYKYENIEKNEDALPLDNAQILQLMNLFLEASSSNDVNETWALAEKIYALTGVENFYIKDRVYGFGDAVVSEPPIPEGKQDCLLNIKNSADPETFIISIEKVEEHCKIYIPEMERFGYKIDK